MIVGGLAEHYYTAQADEKRGPSTPEEWRRQYLEEMRSRLKLEDGQFQQLTGIFTSTRDSYRELRKKWAPEVRAIQDQQADQIRAILNDSQRAEYEKMREERDKRQRGGR
jgi:hypothetical protein